MKKTLKDLAVVLNEKQKPLTAEEAKHIKGGCGYDLRRPPSRNT